MKKEEKSYYLIVFIKMTNSHTLMFCYHDSE